MKTHLTILILALFLSMTGLGAPFQNLGFDAANTNNLVNLGVLYGTPADLVPGWQVYGGSTPLGGTVVGFNVRPLGFGSVSLFDSFNSPGVPELRRIPVEGKFSFGLNPGGGILPGDPFFLVQMGHIPVDALSVRFSAFGEPVDLFIDGVSVPLIYEYESPLPGTGSDSIRATVAGDISPYAGDTVELRFRATYTFGGAQFHGLDSIYFSPIPVPEPSVWAVFALGAMTLVWRWRRHEVVRGRSIS